MAQKAQILDANQIALKINRLAYQIYENNLESEELILAGINRRGLAIAKSLKKSLESLSKNKVRIIQIEIDKRNPLESKLSDDNDLDGKSIIVVDDVANSGRTLLYALHPFLNVIAKKIQIAVLVDRKHKSYPVCADYIGMQISTTLQEHITVEVEKGKLLQAYLS